jgi:photosystem II stability/assembly factor-like uncharacterized protein
MANRLHHALVCLLALAAAACAQDHAGWTVGDSWNGYGTILYSSDSGNTWTRQGTGQVVNANMNSVSAVSPSVAWVSGNSYGGYGTIYRTTDGGATWTRMGSAASIPDTTLTKIHALNATNVWAVGTGTILHTTDGGNTWTNMVPSGYESTNLQGLFAVDATNIWVSGENQGGYATLFKSADAGANWTRLTGGVITNADHLIGISAANAQTVWAIGGTGNGYIVLRTTDGGDTWTWQTGVVGSWDANEICAVSTNVVWAACDMNISWSRDGGASWESQSSGDYTLGISAVSESEAWASRATFNGTIFHTTDAGTNWTQITQLGGETLPGLHAISFAPQAIPEPSAFVLCCLGLGALYLKRRRTAHGNTPSKPAASNKRLDGSGTAAMVVV